VTLIACRRVLTFISPFWWKWKWLSRRNIFNWSWRKHIRSAIALACDDSKRKCCLLTFDFCLSSSHFHISQFLFDVSTQSPFSFFHPFFPSSSPSRLLSIHLWHVRKWNSEKKKRKSIKHFIDNGYHYIPIV